MAKYRWKIVGIVLAVVAYLVLLGYIDSIQSDYDVNIITEKEIYEFSVNEAEYIIPVTIENDSNRMLSSITGQDVFLTYHVYDMSGNLLTEQNARSTFSKGIFAKEKGEAELHITPLEQGEYIIGIDIVHENVAWFSQKADVEKKIQIVIK